MQVILEIHYGKNRVDAYQFNVKTTKGNPPVILIDLKPTVQNAAPSTTLKKVR